MNKQLNRMLGTGLALLMAGTVSIHAQKVSFNGEKMTLGQVLERIEQVSDYKFEYNTSRLNVNREVALNQKNVDVLQVVSTLLQGTGFTYTVKDNYIVIRDTTPTDGRHTRRIKGVIHDMDGTPIIGANVKVKGSTTGVITDLDGNFTLDVGPDAQLEITYIGFDTQSVNVGNRNFLDIAMKESVQQLDELVITAYGTQTRRNVTGSMQTVDFDNLKDIVGGQFTQKIQGQIAGVQVSQSTGTPGSGMSVKIRGAASLSTGANPLYVVDGFPIVGDINNINPSEIESMSILKDAAATALYG